MLDKLILIPARRSFHVLQAFRSLESQTGKQGFSEARFSEAHFSQAHFSESRFSEAGLIEATNHNPDYPLFA